MIKFEDLVATKKRLDELLREAGREGDPFEIQAVCIDRFGIDGYREQFDAGVTNIIVVPWLFYGAGFDETCRPNSTACASSPTSS